MMPSVPNDDFPRLREANFRITSPATTDYNCIASSVGDSERWWQPGVFWPLATPSDEYGVDILAAAYKALGFEECVDARFEPGHEKVALYGSSMFYTHAARQLSNGRWTSKLGASEDIEHETPNDVAGGVYGEVVLLMRRPMGELSS